MKKILLIIMFTVLVNVLMQSAGYAAVHFSSFSYVQAKAQAAKEHKFVMVDVFTDWCHWCKTLDQKTYSAKSVGDYVDANFIAVKIDAEKGDGVDFANLKDVHSYPTILFFDENGTEVDRIVGYQPVDAFLSSLRIARMGGIQGLEMAAAEHPSDPALLFTLGDKYLQKGDTLHGFPYFRSVVKYDVHDAQHLAEQAAIVLASAQSNAGKNAPLERYINDYPASNAVAQAHMQLSSAYLKSGDPEKAASHFRSLVALQPHDASIYNDYAWSCAQAKLNLASAIFCADSAIALATDRPEKASYMDTKSAVLFSQGKIEGAIQEEKLALATLGDDGKNDKFIADLKNTLDLYEQAATIK